MSRQDLGLPPGTELVRVDSCGSTQEEAARLLGGRPDGALLVVDAASQSAGRGREGRSWQDPPGTALLLTVARRGPRPVRVLEELPRRVVDAVLESVRHVVSPHPSALQWRAPNDIVAVSGGEKVGGVLVDARTTGSTVDLLLVGIGINLGGGPFRTGDGRAASSVRATAGVEPARAELRDEVVRRVAALL